MGDKPDDEVTQQQSEGKTKTITRVFPPSEDEDEDDTTMHQAVDGHGKGFFTFNEFLRYLGEDKTPELVDHFDRYEIPCLFNSCRFFQYPLTILNLDTI